MNYAKVLNAKNQYLRKGISPKDWLTWSRDEKSLFIRLTTASNKQAQPDNKEFLIDHNWYR